MFTADNEQLGHFGGAVVSDVDDPAFTPREVKLMRRPNLRAFVVTADRAGRRFHDLGVEAPYHIIPQGISLSSLRDDLVAEAAARAAPGDFVVGWMAALPAQRARIAAATARSTTSSTCSSSGTRSTRACPGRVSGSSAARATGSGNALRAVTTSFSSAVLPREQAIATAANFDIALYPRTKDTGIQAAKVGEFIGLGVPTVSYDYEVTENLRETGAGVLVATPREFVDAVVHLGEDQGARAGYAAAARKAGAALDWDVLARRYEELLDLYLPRG